MDVEIDTKCCRTCLEATTDNFLFDSPELVKKLEFTTSLRIIEGDGLPIYFCNTCFKRLEVSYQFRLQSIRSYKHLKNHINQIHNQFKDIIKSKPTEKDIEKETINIASKTNFVLAEKQRSDHKDLKIEQLFTDNEDPLCSETKKPIKNQKRRKKTTKIINEEQPVVVKAVTRARSINKNEEKKTVTISNDDAFNENDGVEFAKCDICQKMFRKGNLKRHKQTHTGARKFDCVICNKSFTQKSSLQRHHLTHTGEKPYKCETCGKRFSQSNILKFHLTTHGTEKTYNCSICPYRFIKAENLANHIREKHSSGNSDEVTLYVCQFCNKGFKTKYSLKVHKDKLHKDDIVFDMDWSDIDNEDSNDPE